MNLLTLEEIEKSYTEKKVFDKASFYLQEGEKVGIIGINGTGKSTLLKLAAGIEEPDGGRVVKANHVVMRFLKQQPEFSKDDTVLAAAIKGDVTPENHWEIETKAKQLLLELGVSEFDAPVMTLSGGQRKKIAIVNTLLSNADILLMDEPTNHLDSFTSTWLENYLKNYKGALLLVTHDRYFLDSVTNRIAEIDHGKIYSYECSYEGFLERKALREDSEDASERKRRSILRTELEWVQRGARARSTKQKSRLMRYEELKNRKAPVRDGSVEMSSVSTRMGRTTVELHNISKKYEKILLQDFSYIFLKGDRIGFIGENGCGKTTLMKMIVGQVKPDDGEIIIGQTVKIGYYSQEFFFSEKEEEKRVIDYIRDTAEYVRTKDGLVSASQMLDRFLFPPQEQYNRIDKLSGGEKRRLNLLRVLMEAPNVLILDEPTNDLDIQTLTILENYLDDFDGIVITVSHDRYFLDRIVKRMFIFEGEGRIRQFEGNYSDYELVRSVEMEESENGSVSSEKAEQKKDTAKEFELQKKERSKKIKFSFNEQREWDTIEDEIAALEEKVAELEQKILDYSRDFVKLSEVTKEKEETEEKLSKKMDRWMELTEKWEQMNQE